MGALRFFLALVVTLNHVWAPVATLLGHNAVVAFYMMSGFLMTKVLHEVYGTSAKGIQRFLINRVLKIFPAYWLILAVTATLLAALPSSFSWGGIVRMPSTVLAWIENITLFDLTWSETILVPPAWSIGIEVVFYVAMALLLARSRRSIEIWATASLLVTIALVASGAEFGYRYYPVYAASLFFSIGALCHVHQRTFAVLTLPAGLLWPAVALFAAVPIIVEFAGLSPLTWGYYGGAALFVPILMTVVLRVPSTAMAARVDALLGQFAYPVFLSHFIAAGLVTVAVVEFSIEPVVEVGGLVFAALVIIATLLLSSVQIVLFDRWIDGLRARVRTSPIAVRPIIDPVPTTAPPRR